MIVVCRGCYSAVGARREAQRAHPGRGVHGQVKIDDRAAPTLLRSRAPCRLGGKGPGGRL
jgi:hypothetical protein